MPERPGASFAQEGPAPFSRSTCLPTLVRLLNERPRVFVTSLGRVGGIATRSDLRKPPVRMWLFGMITIVEMGLTRLIETRFPEEGWKDLLSASRLEKAEALLAENLDRVFAIRASGDPPSS